MSWHAVTPASASTARTAFLAIVRDVFMVDHTPAGRVAVKRKAAPGSRRESGHLAALTKSFLLTEDREKWVEKMDAPRAPRRGSRRQSGQLGRSN